VCLFQGRAEFIEKYFETVRELRARGFAVATIDWRGQGGSERALSDSRKGYVGDFSEYERDVEALMTEVVLPDCPPPIFAIGHSMGGTVMMRIARQGRRWFDRVVLSAPMIRLSGRRNAAPARITIRTMRLMGMGSAYVPGGNDNAVALGPYVNNIATSDPVRHARTKAVLEAAPELALGSPTVAWLSAAYRAMGEIADPGYPGKIRQPLMMVAAGRDQVVSTAAIEDVAVRLRAGSHLIIAGARHELMMEQDRYRAQFWAAFDAFVPGTPLFK
jgi:lysophospholipase